MAGYQLTEEEVQDFAPELESGITEEQWNELLAQVAEEVSTKQWGKEARARSGALNLAAHKATLKKKLNESNGAAATTPAAGPLLSVTVGPVSKTFANPGGSSSSSDAASVGDLGSTTYGREYQRLRRLWAPRQALA